MKKLTNNYVIVGPVVGRPSSKQVALGPSKLKRSHAPHSKHYENAKLSSESPTPALIASSSTGPHPMQRWWLLRQKASCTTPYRPTVETQRQSSPYIRKSYGKCGSKLSRVPTILCTVLGSEKNARRRTQSLCWPDYLSLSDVSRGISKVKCLCLEIP